jgi:hypothetical protein
VFPVADAAWVRYSAVCGLLRLARAYDAHLPAHVYTNLALAVQEPLEGPRRAISAKLARAVRGMAAASKVGALGAVTCQTGQKGEQVCRLCRLQGAWSVGWTCRRALAQLSPPCTAPFAASVVPALLQVCCRAGADSGRPRGAQPGGCDSCAARVCAGTQVSNVWIDCVHDFRAAPLVGKLRHAA